MPWLLTLDIDVDVSVFGVVVTHKPARLPNGTLTAAALRVTTVVVLNALSRSTGSNKSTPCTQHAPNVLSRWQRLGKSDIDGAGPP